MVHSDLMRAFVNVEEVSYSVSGTVSVIDTCFPHKLAGEYIELCATCALWKFGLRQGDETFQHQGVIDALCVGYRSEGNGMQGYVGCAVGILCTAIQRAASLQGFSVDAVSGWLRNGQWLQCSW